MTSRRSSIGVDVPPVTPTTRAAAKTAGIVEVADVLDLDGRRAGDLAQPGQLLGVRARAATDDDHEIDFTRGVERVLLTPDRDRADGVDDLELVRAGDHQRRELLELPGRLGGLGDQRHPLAARDHRVPFLFVVDDDGVRREPEKPDNLGMLRCPEQDDGVAVFDQLDELALLLDDPGTGAVDDLQAALLGSLHDVGPDAVGADDDRCAVIDLVEGFDRLDAEILEVADDAFVVHDLPEGVRGLAGSGGFLGLVDRLAHAVTESRPLRDADFLDHTHGWIIARGASKPAS